jgi:hypothetical protein
MGVTLLDLVETALRVAKQALRNRAGLPAKLISSPTVPEKKRHSYVELVDRVSLMPAVCDRLGVHPGAPPDQHTEYEIAILDVEYLVHYRGSTPKTTAKNTLIRAKGYTQRWISKTSYSTVKRTQDSALRSRFWYRQFREVVLLFALNTLKKLVKTQ